MHPFEQSTNQTQKNTVPLAFRLEKEDLFSFYQTAVLRAGSDNLISKVMVSKYTIWLIAAGFVVVVLGLLALLKSTLLANFWFINSLLLFAGLAVLSAKQFFASTILLPKMDGPTLGRRTYEIEAEGMVLTQDGVQQAFMWQSIDEVVESETAIYLFVDSNMAHIFPKNVFPSPVQAQEFAAYARERVNLSKHNQ